MGVRKWSFWGARSFLDDLPYRFISQNRGRSRLFERITPARYQKPALACPRRCWENYIIQDNKLYKGQSL